MADEPHDVVKLLVARMESNPEEFNDAEGRWANFLDELIPFVTEEERVMLRKPMMQTIHEEVLDELLNGPEKRRKYKEDREYERHLAHALQQTKQQALMQQAQVAQQNAYGQYQNAMAAAQGLTHGSGGAGLPVSTSPYSSGGGSILPVANGGTGNTGKSPTGIWMDDYVSTGSINVSQPDTTLSSIINQLKQMLGAKK